MSNYTECPSCGTEISKTAKKCSFCGVRLKKPFYKKGWFIFLVLLCLIGGGGYIGKSYFGLDYAKMARQGANWIHNAIVSEETAPAPTETDMPLDTENMEPSIENPPEEVQTPENPPEEVPSPAILEEKPAEDTKIDTAEEGVVICTAAEITRTYENNVLAGNLDYRGKVCRVSGTIKSFGEVGDRSYVILNGWNSGSLVGVRCFVDSLEDVKTLAGMKVGQKLTMEGVCVGLSVNVDLDEAHIASDSSITEVTKPVAVDTINENDEPNEERTENQEPTEAQTNSFSRQASR